MKKLSMEELNRLTVDEFREAPKTPLTIALDNVRSMHNVGSAFRTADAFRIEKIILGGITGRPPHREINKTALGATETVSWTHEERLAPALERLKSAGYVVVSFEQTTKSLPLQEFSVEINKKYCFVFGNEVFGVNDEVLNLSDYCVEIPQFGSKHSLNVSVAIGIAVWDYFQKSLVKQNDPN